MMNTVLPDSHDEYCLTRFTWWILFYQIHMINVVWLDSHDECCLTRFTWWMLFDQIHMTNIVWPNSCDEYCLINVMWSILFDQFTGVIITCLNNHFANLFVLFLELPWWNKGTCNFAVTSDGGNGNITSPNFPEDYPLDIYCVYTLNIPSKHITTIEFSTFILEDNYDRLWVSYMNNMIWHQPR